MPRTASGNRQLIRPFGTQLSFNGSTAEVDLGTGLELLSAFSFTAWVKPANAGGGTQVIVGRGVAGSDSYDYILYQGSNTIKLQRADATHFPTITSTAVINDNTWYHVACTFDGTTGNIYINGVLNGTGNLSSAVISSSGSRHAYIGASRNFAGVLGRYTGKIEEVKFYNTVLTLAQIQAIYCGQNYTNTDTGLLGYYRFDEGSGTAAIDSSGTQANGVITGATYVTDPPLGITTRTTAGQRQLVRNFGTSLYFNGSTHGVSVGNPTNLRLSTGTLSCWFKVTVPSSGTMVIAEKENTYGIFIDANILKIYDWAGSNAFKSTGINVSDGKWHNAVYVFQSGVSSGSFIYLDGSLALTTTMTVGAQTLGFSIGKESSANAQNFVGLIDDVRIYSTALSASSVTSLYYTGIVGNELGWWKFDEGSGTSATDSGSGANTGTITGATYVTDPPLGIKLRTLVT